ncbi:MAG: hypothetical protein NT027_08375 [Proteobacteria bacterium]|nr:hypothetical protein [Pseudomonadota bacterium]
MERYEDWTTFCKVDNATTIDYITSLAAGLTELGQFPKRELDHLKMVLSNQSSDWTSQGKSIISQLIEEENTALKGLMLRYGNTNFALNHMRFNARSLLQNLTHELGDWASQILKKTELVFNRSLFVWNEQRVERRDLFSQALYSLASQIHQTLMDVEKAALDLKTMRPSTLLDLSEEIEKSDSLIAAQIGFEGLDHLRHFSEAEFHALKKISNSLQILNSTAAAIVNQIIPNCVPTSKLSDASIYLELLTAEIERFANLMFPSTRSALVWEMRRSAICFSIHKMTLLISDLSKTLEIAIAPVDIVKLETILSLDSERRIAMELFCEGVKLSDAEAGAKKLIEYCLKHEIHPDQIIDAELKKIHPNLSPKTLQVLRSISSPSVTQTPGGPEIKKQISQKSTIIKNTIKDFGKNRIANVVTCLAVSSFVSLLFLASTSCGLKTGIKSNIEELRPPLPPLKPIPKVVDPSQETPHSQDKTESSKKSEEMQNVTK